MNRPLPVQFAPVDVTREATHALLPQRPPLLLVDALRGLGRGPRPALRASYRITGDEPVLAGHFPGRPLWPGSYTIEGLAQSCAVLGGFLAAHALSDASSAGPGALPALPASWVQSAEDARAAASLLCAVDVKLVAPVIPPAELIYEVVLTHVVGAICRFEVEASCARRTVARGTLSVAYAGGTP